MRPGCSHPLFPLSQQFLKQQMMSTIAKKTASSLTRESALVRPSHPSDGVIRDSARLIRYHDVKPVGSVTASPGPQLQAIIAGRSSADAVLPLPVLNIILEL